tara:strand:- start:530 stop:865 length:336 start_codon:yes stop_codon:yes gene_type:complete
MHYEIKQTEQKKYFFNLIKINKTKSYKFKDYKNAVNFALNEQIKNIYCIIGENIKTLRKPFKNFYTLEQFIKVSKKNPLFYLGTHNPEKINIPLYYFYLINKNKFHKLKKF